MLKDVLIQKGLSNREAEVAELVTQGLSNREVASQLFVTEKTVKFHLTNIYKKMSVKSRAQLIVWCLPHMEFIERGAASVQVDNNNNTTSGGSGNVPTGNETTTTGGNKTDVGGRPSSTFLPTLSTGWDGKKDNESF